MYNKTCFYISYYTRVSCIIHARLLIEDIVSFFVVAAVQILIIDFSGSGVKLTFVGNSLP